MRYSQLWPILAKQWDRMQIKPGRVAEFNALARYAIAHKDVYQAIEKATGVPWAMIAVIHRREGDADFGTYLGNGQSLSRRTTEVPRGRGPFTGPDAFYRGALDALKFDGLDDVKDWRVEKQLYHCESFNGFGYGLRPSPYIWGGTNVQQIGKYIRDHVFSSTTWDMQPGCAPILYAISKLDPSVTFTRETPP